jgi:uncharacterized membrane protein
MKKSIAMFFIFGLIGLLVEVGFTAICSFSFALKGHTSVWMVFVYGLAGIILDKLNENKLVNKWFNMFWQTVLGTFIIYLIEFCSGCILNIGFGLDIWSYKTLGLDVMGQITFWYAPLWFALCPFAFWAGDWMQLWISDQLYLSWGKYPILRNYYLALKKPFGYTDPKNGYV